MAKNTGGNRLPFNTGKSKVMESLLYNLVPYFTSF
jgi:hypothetical protein